MKKKQSIIIGIIAFFLLLLAISSNSDSTTNENNSGQQYSDLSRLVIEFEGMPSDQGNKLYDRLSEDQIELLSIATPNYYNLLHYGLCQSNPDRKISIRGKEQDCQQAKTEGDKLLGQLASSQEAVQNFQGETQMILVYEFCNNGQYVSDITPESCQTFLSQLSNVISTYHANQNRPANTAGAGAGWGSADYNTMSDISAMMHNTSMGILNNIGGSTCTLGEPDCVPF